MTTLLDQLFSPDSLQRVANAITAIRAGGMVIMVDDEDRENEGDLVFAAEFATPERINFLAKEARGLICLALEAERVKKLKLPLMQHHSFHSSHRSTAFTVSIEARDGVSTGISAADRAKTIQVAIDDTTQPDDLVVPGHVFPLQACLGGVIERAGHTEGSVDLVKFAGLKPAAVICEIMNDNGTMARMPDLIEYAQKFNIPIVSIADLIEYSLLHHSLIEETSQKDYSYNGFDLKAYFFKSKLDGSEHLALVKNKDKLSSSIAAVRVHNQNPVLDVLGSLKLDSVSKINYIDTFLSEQDCAVFLYLGSMHQANNDMRIYGTGAQILRHIGVQKMIIHTSKPKHLKALSGFGLEVIEQRII